MKKVSCLRIAGPVDVELIPQRILEFRRHSLDLLVDQVSPDPDRPWTAGPMELRAANLISAIEGSIGDFILCARGGYGTCEILDQLPWSDWRERQLPTIIGFSDISALHSALYTLLGQKGVHGPMPLTHSWNPEGEDVALILKLLKGRSSQPCLPILNWTGNNPIQGKLFGGNLAVLSNLIGTPYLPKDFSGHILFFEDVGEAPGRLMRYWYQWLHSGLLKNASAVVFGDFSGWPDSGDRQQVWDLLQSTCPVPSGCSGAFGHTELNMPIPVGVTGNIGVDGLTYQLLEET